MAMRTTAQEQNKGRLFLLGRGKKRLAAFGALQPHAICTVAEVRQSVRHAGRDSLWVSYDKDLTDELVKSTSAAPTMLGLGLFVHSLDTQAIPALSSVFHRIAFTADGGFIPAGELAEVLEAENCSDLFIGGVVHQATETITFWRGNLEPLTVPFSAFTTSGDGTQPNFNEFSVTDSGQTVQLGPYEAAVDAILYEFDPQYRRAISRKRLQEDQSFGAALRRLRKQRGLRREAFEPDISAKTIARIEQGKVRRIQQKTLAALAKHLNVEPDEIASF
jgi:DNA-binding Xre family transcriptional regulator